MEPSIVGPITKVLDLLETLILGGFLLVVAPLLFLRHYRNWAVLMRNSYSLIRVGQLASTMRACLAYKLGALDRAILGFESILAILEQEAEWPRDADVPKELLECVYSLIAQTYLRQGYVDEAAFVVVKACRSLQLERLKGMNGFDLRAAQIVKTAVTASKLVEEGNMALVLKVDAAARMRNNRDEASPPLSSMPQRGAKVIPFRPRTP